MPRCPRSLSILLAATALSACRGDASSTIDARSGDAPGAPAAPGPALAPGPAWAPPRAIVTPAATAGDAPQVTIEVPSPAFARGTGPRVAIDAGHHNFQIRGNFAPFAGALADDGFVVDFMAAELSAASLAGVDVLVIVNAQHPSNVDQWTLPTPSAFTAAEIEAVAAWIDAGGGLWLVADHHPFPGAAAALAARVGFTLQNGFAFRERSPGTIDQELIPFHRADGTLLGGHPITDGARPEERIDQLLSFTGEAFELPADAHALFVLPADGVLLLPTTAWEFTAETPRRAAGGWAAAAVRVQGRGRVAVFGEAAMLSARHVQQEGGWWGVGVIHPEARDNLQLVLNTARWLAG